MRCGVPGGIVEGGTAGVVSRLDVRACVEKYAGCSGRIRPGGQVQRRRSGVSTCIESRSVPDQDGREIHREALRRLEEQRSAILTRKVRVRSVVQKIGRDLQVSPCE